MQFCNAMPFGGLSFSKTVFLSLLTSDRGTDGLESEHSHTHTHTGIKQTKVDKNINCMLNPGALRKPAIKFMTG